MSRKTRAGRNRSSEASEFNIDSASSLLSTLVGNVGEIVLDSLELGSRELA